MRLTALVPVLCCTAALILSFLCLFAGHKESFMEDYHLMTLNTSRLGQTFLNESHSSENPILNYLDKIPNAINGAINDAIGDVADELGIDDWYSAHLLNYCAGGYTPTDVANATVPAADIDKNVTECGRSRAMYRFDPTKLLQDALNKTRVPVTLDDLDWPSDIEKGVKAINVLMAASFVLYCVAIASMFLALAAAAVAVCAQGRLAACVNFGLGLIAFLAIGLASALVTAVVVKGTGVINEHGNKIGVEAYRGGKFLALTWAATALMFITIIVWVVEFCVGGRKKVYGKHG